MRVALLALLTAAGLSACGGAHESPYPACVGALQYHDRTYREVGFTDHKGTVLEESAQFASCDAVTRDGAEPRGVVGFEVILGAYSPLSMAAMAPVSLSG
jgi:hypothetical protein